jgi:hypothetical protein
MVSSKKPKKTLNYSVAEAMPWPDHTPKNRKNLRLTKMAKGQYPNVAR